MLNLERQEMKKHKYTIGKLRSKVDKEIDKLRGQQSSGRFATLYEPEQVTLCKSVIETIKTLTKDKEKRKSFELFARTKKFEFYKDLCQKIQKNFPIDNSLLTKLAYVDPAKIDLEKTESSFQEICNHMPSFIKDETDDVISQLRSLRLNKTDFDQERYQKYLKDSVDDTIPFKDIVGIDDIWSPIKRNRKYPSLGRFLKAVLSFIHL